MRIIGIWVVEIGSFEIKRLNLIIKIERSKI